MMMRLYCSKCQKVFEAEKPTGSSQVKCPVCGAEQDYPETVPGPGVVVGDFLIEKLLSRGGMGEVFLAKQISLDRPVALKVLQQKHLEDKEYVDSLFKEARAAAKLSHPNIVQAYAVGEDNGIFYFAMEYIRGETFKQILKREKSIEFTRAATVVRDIARALGAAWREQKLVHQDIKPDNIMLDANGFAKLADLGLAKVATGGSDDASEDGDEVLGTPQYISPEQLTGVPTDIRSDIYSLGATFYHFVTGRFPYVADTGDEIARMHVECQLQPPKEVNPELPDELNRIIVKMMEKDINRRYQTAEELIADIDAYLRNAPAASAAKKSAKAAPPTLSAPKKLTPPKKPSVPKLAVPTKSAAAKPVVSGEVPAAKVDAPAPKSPADDAKPPVEPEAPAEADDAAEASSGLSRPLKIALISVGSVLLLAVIALAALVVCFKMQVALPGKLNSFAGTVSGWFGITGPKTGPAGKAAPGSVRKNAAAKPAPPKPSKYERIAALPTDTKRNRAIFCRQATAALAGKVPTEPREREAYLRLREKLAPLDEEMNFTALRVERRKTRDEIVAKRQREQEERRERERIQREERERRRQLAENEERARRAEEERKKRREQAAYEELKRDVDKALEPLLEGFFTEVRGGKDAVAKAIAGTEETYFRSPATPRERQLVEDYGDFRRRLPAETKKFMDFCQAMKNINDDINILCNIPGEGACRVVALYPDGSADVLNRQFQRRHIPAGSLARSRNFRVSFAENLKDRNPNALFYYDLMTGKWDDGIRKNAPAGFWKKYLPWFIRFAETR